jgi:hypothetical protein
MAARANGTGGRARNAMAHDAAFAKRSADKGGPVRPVGFDLQV